MLIKTCFSFDTSDQNNLFSFVANRDVLTTMKRSMQYTISQPSYIAGVSNSFSPGATSAFRLPSKGGM